MCVCVCVCVCVYVCVCVCVCNLVVLARNIVTELSYSPQVFQYFF